MPVRKLLFVSLTSAAAGAVAAAVALLVVLPEWPGASAHPPSHQHATVAASFCGISPSHGGQSPFLADMGDVNERMHAAMEIVPTGDVNQDFIRMMIPHHQGAIDMARVLLKYQPEERLRRLAQSIIVEQGQEIAYMQTLLRPPPPAASAPAAPPASKGQP
jgi:Domain of unknown function (DUF305)